jgi:hypothetical protein
VLDDLAVVTPKQGGQVLFLTRTKFYLLPQVKRPEERRRLSGAARLDDGVHWFRIQAESYRRYKSWEHGEDVEESYFSNFLKRRRELKTLARIALALIFVAILFFTVVTIDMIQRYG